MQLRGALARVFASVHAKEGPSSADGDIIKKNGELLNAPHISEVTQLSGYSDEMATKRSIACARLLYDVSASLHACSAHTADSIELLAALC